MIGLDGVVAQQENHRKSGFSLAYVNVRYGGTVAAPAAPSAAVVPLSEVPFAAVEADDATVFPAPRPAFLRAWIGAPGHVGRALVRDGALAAWGVIRPCRTGHKIGPLAPAMIAPEGFAVRIAADQEDRAAADAQVCELGQASIDELGGDALAAETGINAQVIEVAAATVVATENCARQRLFRAGHKAQPRIAVENPRQLLGRLVGPHPHAGIPQGDHRRMVGSLHGLDMDPVNHPADCNGWSAKLAE